MRWNFSNRRRGAPDPVGARSLGKRRSLPFRLEWLEDRVLPSLLSTFELDGNATTGVLGTAGSTTTSHDWDQVYNDAVLHPGQNTSGSIPGSVAFVTDPVNSGTDNIFTGGSSADINNLNQWQWTTSTPQNKADLADAFAAGYTEQVNGQTHKYLYFGADRYDNNGATTLGFWFFQNPVSALPLTGKTATFSGTHTVGDLLILADFSSAAATINAYEWVGPGGSQSSLKLLTPTPADIFLIANTVNTPTGGWPFQDKLPSPPNTFAPGEFIEGGIDLTGLGLPNCNATFVAETRASPSLTSTLSDFVIGTFSTCVSDLAVTKTDGVTSVVPGGSTTYTITVSNAGPDAADGTTLSDPLPAGVTGGNWSFVSATGGGSVTGPASGTGALATTVDLPVNATVTFSFTVQVSPAATGTLTNTATVSAPPGVFDPNPANNTATDTNTLTAQADLAITKTDGVASVVPGTPTTYTIVVRNNGPSAVSGASVSDRLPAGVTSATWTTIDSSGGGSVSGPSAGTGALATTVDLPVNATITFSFTVQVAPAATGTLINTATVSPPPGVTDPNPSNNSASDTDTLTPQADLAITKTDGVTSVVSGTANTYVIIVSNLGPSAVTGASVADPLPAHVTSATWTATASSGGGVVTGPSSGAGPLATTVDLPVNASVTFGFTVQIDPSATGTLTNTATVTPPAAVTDPNPANNSATDTNTVTPQADLSITKTDGVTSAVPGTSTTYTIVVTNAGPSTAVDQTVTDNFPSAITAVSWTAVASAGSSVASASGTGNIKASVTLLPGGTVTFTAVAQISSTATGSLSNTASVTVPPGDNTPEDNSATDTNSLTPQTGLSITKTDGVTFVVPGTSTTYTIIVSNAGPSAAMGATLSDPVPDGVSSATWMFVSATDGGSVIGPTSGTGALSATINVPVGATLTFHFTAAIDPTATGTVVNTATVTPQGGTPIRDTDIDTLTPQADLSVTKDDRKIAVVPGTAVTFTITVSNSGPSTVNAVTLTDASPAALLNPAFGTPSAGSYDPTTGVWSGLSLATGQSVTITLTGTIDPAATGTLTNTVHVDPPPGVTDPNPANNNDSHTDTLTPQADLAVTKNDGKTSAVPGTPNTYTITVSNAGPSTVSSVVLTDSLPPALLSHVFGAPSTGSYDPTTGVWSGLNLAEGQSVTIILTGTVDPAATGTLTNTATVSPPAGVTDPNPGNNTATDTDTLTPQADLAITKTNTVTTVVPGAADTYIIVVSNLGPSAVTGASVFDPVPAGVTGATWTVSETSDGGAVTGPASGTGALATTVDLPVNASETFTFTVQVDPSATGTLTNTATVSPPAGVTDPNPANNSATDTTSLTPQADLAITKTDGVTSVVPGTSTTYTIVVSNAGPSTAVDQAVTDLFASAITAVSWTAVASPGSSVAATSGSGDIITMVTLLPGGAVTFTAVAQISPDARRDVGSLVNTATVAVPPGDNTPDDNTATDINSLTPETGLSITKTDGQTTAVPGLSTTYTIVVSNAGPSAARGATLSDPLPAGVTTAAWASLGATGGGVVTGPSSGTGALATTVDLPVNATVTFSFTVQIDPSATGILVNTATITPPGGTPTGATDTDSLTPRADLAVTKDDGKLTAVPGTPDTYTITVTNNGPSTVDAVNLTDTLPAALLNPVFGAPSAGSYDPATGIWSGLSLAAGQSVTITLSGTVDPAATGTLTNTATVSPPAGVTDPNPGNNNDSDTNTLTPQADLAVSKTDGKTTAVPGTADTYTITVSNAGPSTVSSVVLRDSLPAALLNPVFGTPSAGSYDPATGVWSGLSLAAGQSVTIRLTGTIDPAATGTLTNTATVSPPAGVTDPNPGNNTATDTDTLTPQADLSITKDDAVTSVVPGTADTYTIVVSNLGPSDVSGASVSDLVPAGVTTATWTVSDSSGGGAVTGPSSGTGALATTVDLPVNATVTFTFTVQIDPSATGTLVNTATIAPPSGVTDTNPANNTATDTDILTPQSDVSITKDNGVTSVVPGGSTTYAIVVRNAGPSTAVDQTVTDNFPSAITAVSWTAVASTGSSVALASGTGNIKASVTLLPGGIVTFTAVAQISSTATGSLSNTASVTIPPGDNTPADNTATDTDSLTPQTGLSITKTDGVTSVVPGTSTTYTIIVSNAGPSAAMGATLSDPVPDGVSSATWTFVTATGGGSVIGPSSGTGDLATTVDLPVGATMTFSFTAAIDPTATGTLVNTATITAQGGTPIGDTDINTLTPQADLSVTKDDGQTEVVPGTPVTYTITVSNSGPSTVNAVNLTDTSPATLLNPTFGTPSAGSYDPATGLWSGLSLATGQSVTIRLTGTVDPAATGSLRNRVHVSPPSDVTDPNPGNNNDTDTNTLTPEADLSITKTDGVTSVVPGTSTTYTIVVRNAGPSAVTGATVLDSLPVGATGGIWAFAGATGGGAVTGPSGGSGGLATTVDLPVGATATFTFTVQVSASATGTLDNTATIAPPSGVTDTNPANNTATDTDTLTPQADLSITKDDGVTSVVPGTPDTYIIVVSNLGPSAVTGASVSDPVPAGVTAASWTATASSGGGAVTGPTSGSGALTTTVDLPVNATVTSTFTVQIDPSATGTLVNNATVAPPSGVTDTNPANNTATDTDFLTPLSDLSITKDDGVTSVVPGTSTTYAIVVTNAGPSTAVDQAVTDNFPSAITAVSWTAVASAGSSVAATSGSGNIAATVTLLPGGTVTFIAVAQISASATGTLTNTATVAVPPGDNTPDDNSATDINSFTPVSGLSITKDDGRTTVVPGTSTTYTIVVSNAGPSDADGATLSDPVPAGVTAASWTFVSQTGGGSVTGPSSGTGALDTTVNLPVGATLTFSFTAAIDPTATGTLVNIASITPAGGAPIDDTDINTLTPQADLSVNKDDGQTNVVPGTAVTYTITVRSSGPSTVNAVRLTDRLPAALLNPTFGVPSAGSYDPSTGVWSGLSLGSGQSVTITLTGTVDPAATGSLTNRVHVAPPPGVTDTNPGNNTDTDTNTLTPEVDLSITKTNGLTSVVPGTSTTYTIVVANTGPSDVSGASVTDPLPAGATGGTWAFAGAADGGAVSGPSGGSGALETTVDLPVGASVTFTFTVEVSPSATGTLVNTATVAPPPGVTDTNPANNSATDTDTLTPQADLSITKDDGVTSVVPGTANTYIIVVSNLGPSDVSGATVSDPVPAGVTGATWTATASSGGGAVTGPSSGAGAVATTVDLPVNATVTFSFTVQIDPSATGTLTNTATVATPAGVTDTNPANNTATHTDILTPQSDLSITKDNGVTSVVPGGSTTYAIVVRNAGPSTAVDQTVTDNFPSTITAVSWTAVASAGSSVALASGTGNIKTSVTLLPGGTVTFTAVAQISSTATGSLSNTASVTIPPGDNTPADNTATDTDSLTPQTGLSITKTDGVTSVVPGTSTTYTIIVSNAGPSAATGATLSDPVPAGVSSATWTFVTATGGGSVTGLHSGTGALNTTVSVPVGATLTFSFTVAIEPTATGTLVNTATITAEGGTPIGDTDIDELTPQADLSITKDDGKIEVVPGTAVTYTITVRNSGPSTVNAVNLTDTSPATLLNPTFGTPSTGSYDPATGVWSGLNLANGQSVTITLTGTVDSAATGSLTNRVHVAPPPGVTDTNPGNNTDTDTDTLTPEADLSITKNDGVTSVVAGTSTTYKIVVSNAGPSTVSGASVSDPLPAGTTGGNWAFTVATGGGSVSGPAGGSGSLSTTVDLPSGATVTFTFTVNVSASATGTLDNTATVTPPAGVTDTNPANNSATDTDTLMPQADLSITKDDGVTSVVPGTANTYIIVVSNLGPSAVTGARVSDALPAGVTSASWTATDSTGGGAVTGPDSGSGALATTVDLSVNASVTFSFTVQIDPSATGLLTNTATVTPPTGVTDTNPTNNSATDTNTLTPQSDLSITKTDGVTSVVPGTSTTYAIVVTNAGPSTAVDQAVTDLFPPAITAVSWTAVASAGSSVVAASGTGNIFTSVTLLPGGTVTFTAVGQISPSATGTLSNTATVAVPPGDSTPDDNTATDTNSLTPLTGLAITKDDGQTTVVPGTSTTYTIVVSNAGPSTATGASLSDPVPAGVTAATWTFVSHTGGGTVTGPASGTGDLATTVDLPVGATVTFTFTAAIDPTATGTLENIATITPAGGTPIDATDTNTLTPEADLSVTKDDGKTSAVPGTGVTYTITVRNAGPSTVSAVKLTDDLPAALFNPVFGTPSTGSYNPATGVWSGLSLAAGQHVTITLAGTIAPSATGALTNTVHVAPPPGVTDPDPGNNNDSDTNTLTPQADLSITKTNGVTSLVPGTSTTYTIVVSNAGPSDVSGASVTDPLPAGTTGGNWAFTAATGGGTVSAPTGGSGSLGTTVDLPVGATVTFTFTVQVSASATGTLDNIATVTPPAGVTDTNPANNTATDTDTLTPHADLAITKTDGVTSVVPGTADTYIIVVSNLGPSAVTGASVADALPTGVTTATWTATDSTGGGAVTGPATGSGALATTVDLPVNASVTFSFTVQIDPSATGSLTNTAAVMPPTGVTDTNPANNSATDTNTLTPQSDLSITKTDGVTSVVPGTSTTYAIVVTNAGPSTAVDQAVTDNFPAAITSVQWTAVASTGSSVAASSGTGNIDTTVTLLPGGTVTFTAVTQISESATGTLSNTATVAVPPGDNTPDDNTATDTNSLTPLTGLAITKDDGQTTVVPGTSTTYTIVVSNAGPSTATGAALSDPLPTGVTAASWTFVSATGGGSVTGAASGTGALATTVDLPVGATITFNFTAAIDPTATGTVVNTATITPAGGTPIDATDTNTLTPQADLSVTKDDGQTSAVPGTGVKYTITVRNAGPSTVSAVNLTDDLPAALLNPVFGTPSAGSYNPATGVWSGLSLAAGQHVTIALSGTIDPSATGVLTNTVHVAPPPGVTDTNPGNNNDSDTNTLTPEADLSITKTDGVTSVVPGHSTTYTIVVSNAGPSAVSGASVSDPLPAGVTSATWMATANSGGGTVTGPASSTGALGTTVDLPVGATVTFTFTVQVSPSATGTLDNTATVSPPAGVTDTNLANNSATDSNTLTPQVDLAITKTNNAMSVVPGASTTYTIVVSNAGPSAVTGASVSDPLPAGVTTATWAFAGATGGGAVSGPTRGSGALATSVDLPVDATVTFSFTVQIDPSATGSLTNTATVTPATGVTDTNPANNSATDSSTLTPEADLAITKTNGVTSVVPGTSTTYVIVVSNNGPSAVTGASVSDPLPTGVTGGNWAFALATGGGAVTGPSSGSGNLGTNVDLPVNATVTFTFTVQIASSATGTLDNTATVAPPAGVTDTNPANNSATDSSTLTGQADLALTKTVNDPTPHVGETITFTITLHNFGPSDASGVAVTDELPAGLTFVSATPQQGRYNSVTGVWTVGTVVDSASLTLSIAAIAKGTGRHVNTAAITSSDQADSNLGNNSSNVTIIVTPAASAPVTVVSLKRFGFHEQPTVLVVGFSGALETHSAQDLNNYSLVLIAHGGRLHLHVPIVQAAYNPTANTVSLRPTRLLPLRFSYVLTVNASTSTGVRAANGELVDGNGDGLPGGNYVRQFGRNILSGPSKPFFGRGVSRAQPAPRRPRAALPSLPSRTPGIHSNVGAGAPTVASARGTSSKSHNRVPVSITHSTPARAALS
jgi:uncharacterized repeat protein (TIGR01451 family)